MLAVLWLLLALAVLIGAGYSHYRYRVKNNRYYAQLYSKDVLVRDQARPPTFSPYAMPVTVLTLLCIVLPLVLAL